MRMSFTRLWSTTPAAPATFACSSVARVASVNSLFEDYGSGMGTAYDEMYDGTTLRKPYRQLQPSLHQMGQRERQPRVEAPQSSYLAQGVTFDIGGEERAFPLDVLPRVIEMDQWAKVETGVQQRGHTLGKLLDDPYDAGRG